MSSDLLEDCKDSRWRELDLTMNASGCAFLSIYDEAMDEVSYYFTLTPDTDGVKRAEMIEIALTNWIKHIKDTGLVKK